jgi:hypothetical protein
VSQLRQAESVLGRYHQAESKATLLHAINGAIVMALNSLVFVGADKFTEVRVAYGPAIKAPLTFSAVRVASTSSC